jgi:hypothetical protein
MPELAVIPMTRPHRPMNQRLETMVPSTSAVTPAPTIFGVIPLVANGVGAKMRQSPGTAVFSKMLGVIGTVSDRPDLSARIVASIGA